ncbi:hypothetical protein SAICODRAFT_58502, partial [Saitoella complicata NRRL Y-17804]|uniref:uncharacterized protein n=1 Tax=Saitoella complicata (strain BCRC 22490 / CBS 7301 / JCM 7358 / NBRC 10748 / NRRL Y-17804) TaxID=698492 RepID=UPI000867B36F
MPDLTSHGDVHIPFDPAQGHADPSRLLGLTLHPPDFSLPDFSVAIALRIENLDVMDALATRILGVLAKGPYQETLNIVTRLDTLDSQAYRVLVSAFTSLKKLYSEEAFFNADLLGLIDPEQRGVVRKTNLATFVSSVFGSTEVGFFHLNEHFLDVFVPDGGRLLKPQGQLFLDLKTQAYISAMTQAERPQHEIIEELFPSILPQLLVARHPHSSKNLSQSETDFINKAQQRREVLEQTTSPEGLAVLGEKYVWQGFLKDVAEYVAKNHESIVGVGGRKRRAGMNGTAKEPQMPKPSRRVQVIPGYPAQHHWQGADGTPVALHKIDPTLSTQQQYERARAAARPNPTRRGKPTQRRHWSKEEEDALFAGLDALKGPHWSQILALYGPGGSISEALKDRTQVQLKDKARNLKLWFLKNNFEVPHYLKCVTGDLKR